MDTSEPRWWVRIHSHTEADKEDALVALHDFDIEAIVEEDTHLDVYFKTHGELLRYSSIRPGLTSHLSPPGAGEVFGETEHPTTQLVLAMMYDAIFYGDWVADIGSGSGRLSAAAAHTAKRIVAVDIDWPAVRASKRALNLMHAHVVQGSADCLASSRFRVILANLHLAAWRYVAPDIARIAAPEADLLASGFLNEQLPEVEELLHTHGWRITQTSAADRWLAVRAARFS